MKITFTLLLTLLSACVLAQPTLTSSKMLPFGSSFNLKYCSDLSPIDTTIQGANKTWDFSSLLATAGDDNLITIVNPAQTPYSSTFTTSNYGYYGLQAGTTYYDYYKLSSTDMQRMGSWDTNNGVVTYSDPQLELKFPETLGTTSVDTWDNSASSLGGGNYNFQCVGYGTLKLPGNQTYTNALMVRVRQTEGSLTDYFVFFWYSSDNGAILVEAAYGDGFFSPYLGYYISSLSVGINDPILASEIHYNNPVQNTLSFDIKSKSDIGAAKYTLVNMQGAVVATGNLPIGGLESLFTINMSGMSNGIYMVNLMTTDGERIAQPIKVVKM